MMARCKLNPCCGATMPGECDPPPQIKPNEGWDAYEQRATSLSPAATPVSEAGGEAAERSWRRTKFEFIGAMRQALINSGLTREQVIIADNAITEAFSDLAKPASSATAEDHGRAAFTARAYAHHALWEGLPTDSIEAFGKALAFRIEAAIRAKTASNKE